MVGNGRSAYFWDDVWCAEKALKLEFPDAFFIAVSSKAKVEDYASRNGENVVWVRIFRRALFDWEISSITRLLGWLREFKTLSDREDWRLWTNDPNGFFTVKSCYEHLEEAILEEVLWRMVLYKALPHKV